MNVFPPFYTAFGFALMQVILLLLFLRLPSRHDGAYRWVVLGACILLQTVAQCFDTREKL